MAHRLIDRLGIYGLMVLAGALYAIALVVVTLIEHEPVARSSDRAAPAAPRTGSAIALIVRDRYLLLIGALLLVANLVNTQGEYILADAVKTYAGQFPKAAHEAIIGRFYGAFYGIVNGLALVVQALLVARLLKRGGTRWALFLLPWIALLGYGGIALVPSLVVVATAKAVENSFDYSMEATVEQTLFLPTRREIKYTGKAAVDTICVRLGDMAAGGLVLLCLHVFALSRRGFAVANLILVAIWLLIAVAVARRHRSLAGDTRRRVATPASVRAVPVGLVTEAPPTRG
jgi:AAA family ATP:ADP antiporter